MALAHHEVIPVRIILVFRADVHFLQVQAYQDFHDAEISADMAVFCPVYHVQYIFTKRVGQRL